MSKKIIMLALVSCAIQTVQGQAGVSARNALNVVTRVRDIQNIITGYLAPATFTVELHLDDVITALAYAHSGKLLALGVVGGGRSVYSLKIYDAGTFKLIAEQFINQKIDKLTFSPDDAYIVAQGNDNTLFTVQPLCQQKQIGSQCNITFLPNGPHIHINDDYYQNKHIPLSRLTEHMIQQHVSQVAYSSDERLYAFTEEWEVDNPFSGFKAGSVIRLKFSMSLKFDQNQFFAFPGYAFNDLVFSPDNKYLAGTYSKFWDREERPRKYDAPVYGFIILSIPDMEQVEHGRVSSRIRSLQFSPRRDYLFAKFVSPLDSVGHHINNKMVCIWKKDGAPQQSTELQALGDSVAFTYSPCGERIATGIGNRLTITDIGTTQLEQLEEKKWYDFILIKYNELKNKLDRKA